MGMYLMSMHLMGVYLMGVHVIGVYLMDMHLTGMYLIGTYGRASHGRVSLTGVHLLQGEPWIISLVNDLCAKLPRTRIRLSPELALEIAPPIHSDRDGGG